MSIHNKTLLKKTKDLCKWKVVLYSWVERLTLTDSVLIKEFYRILMKISVAFFPLEKKKPILKPCGIAGFTNSRSHLRSQSAPCFLTSKLTTKLQ